MQPEVRKMLNGDGCNPKPVRTWRKCPLIQASRRSEFRPLPDGAVPEIRPMPKNVRESLNGCMTFQSQQIARYNELLRRDGKLVSGVDKVAAGEQTKSGRLYHKFDSLCALATSKSARLLLVQHKELHHIFYAIRYDPVHALYNELLNIYEQRWNVCSSTYGKLDGNRESRQTHRSFDKSVFTNPDPSQ